MTTFPCLRARASQRDCDITQGITIAGRERQYVSRRILAAKAKIQRLQFRVAGHQAMELATSGNYCAQIPRKALHRGFTQRCGRSSPGYERVRLHRHLKPEARLPLRSHLSAADRQASAEAASPCPHCIFRKPARCAAPDCAAPRRARRSVRRRFLPRP